jgi:hypothetical protein
MKIKTIVACLIAVILLGVGVWFLWPKEKVPSREPTPGQTSNAPFIQLSIRESDLADSKTSKSLKISISSSHLGDITKVEYLLDGKVVVQNKESPFSVVIDISTLAAGNHTIQAIAYNDAGQSSKSEVFTFTVDPDQTPVPADNNSRAILYQSRSTTRLAKSSQGGSSSANPSPGSPDNDGGNGGGANPLPETPPAEICGNASILDGPTSAPQGAIIVPAGDNSAIDFSQDNKTWWFAPGDHHLGSGEFSQIGPGNNSTFVGAPAAVIDGQGLNRYAFSGHATNVKIQHLTIKNFIAPRDEGVVNHNSGINWTMEYITAENNKGGAVFAGTNNIIRYSCLKDNGQYGFQVYSGDPGGPYNVVLDHNEIAGNNTDDWESQVPGCGCTGGGKFWDAHTVTITNNYVHHNLSAGLWADTNDSDFLVEGNYISDNEGQGLFYEISYNMIVRNNNFIRNALTGGPTNGGFPSGAIYLSEAGGDNRVSGRTANIEIYDNKFTDNWSGVILWENADRFCASPSNTSTGYCTIVNPAATLTTCSNPATGGLVDQQPYYSDCRWKTQNVKVHHNIFSIDKDAIPQCNATLGCGMQGIFSNFGSSPSWSPYMGDVIQNDITFNQNNLFTDNTYMGSWNFMAKTQGSSYNFALWQARFGQDTGSTINGQSQYLVANALDANTATLEGSKGTWTNWFNVATAQSTDQAHGGTHSLKVTPSDQFWGIESTATGFPVTPANKTISYWGKAATGTVNISMEILFVDENQQPLGSTIAIPLTLNASGWLQASQNIPTPSGAENVIVKFDGGNGPTGGSFYLDDIVVADRAS